jgi:hypothetical protein
MIRNLKALGLGLAAVLALSAVVASVAAAEAGELTASKYPAHLSGGPIPGELNVVTALGGLTMQCEGVFGTGEITEASTEGTVELSFEGCTAGSRPVTGTTNGCNLRIYSPQGENDSWTGKGDVVCPEGKKAEAHIYNDAGHTSVWCTMTMGSQTGLSGLTAINETAQGTIRAEGTVTGIAATAKGACTAGLNINFNATLHVHARISAAEGTSIQID